MQLKIHPASQYVPGRIVRVIAATLVIGCTSLASLGCWHQSSYENMPVMLSESHCIADVCLGEAGRDDVVEKLLQNDLVFNVRDNGGTAIHFSVDDGGVVIVQFRQDEGQSDEIVEQFEVSINDMPLQIALGSLGEPDELFLMFGCGYGSHIHGKLFYRDKGVEVEVQFPAEMEKRANAVILTEQTPVIRMWYFEPSTYDQWLLNSYENWESLNGYFSLPQDVTAEMLIESMQPWPGLNVSIRPIDMCPR